MTKKLLVIMDAPQTIHHHKDTSLALLLKAACKGWQIYYAQPKDLFFQNHAQVICQHIQVNDAPSWYMSLKDLIAPLTDFEVILLRKDPPFNEAYLYTTYLLELAQKEGCVVVNNPRAVRDANEKLFALHFKNCIPPHLISTNCDLILEFLNIHKKIILKPLNSMGGDSIFFLEAGAMNTLVIVETLTQKGHLPVMAQRYIPEIRAGDKRIILIGGEPFPYGLKRIPKAGDFRGNLVKGARPEGYPITEHDRWICAQIGPTLKEKGLHLVGIDVIGDYLTEINVTSPTCVREIEAAYPKIDLSGQIWDYIEHQITH